MEPLNPFHAWRRAGLGLAIMAVLVCAASLFSASGADAKAHKETKKKAEKKTDKKVPLTGAELYSIHCGRCHPERYATERSPAQWKTLMAHMRVRANLPAREAKAILKYLQEDSGTP